MRELSAGWHRIRGRRIVHFLHVGKTGGTAVKRALGHCRVSDKQAIMLHSHDFRLRDVPVGEKAFFFLRDPVSRFASGFMSRQRMGHPYYHVPWTDGEKQAFAVFSNPCDLALALSDTNPAVRERAHLAMKHIGHVNSHYGDWFDSESYLEERAEDILFVGFQESLDTDFSRLRELLDIPETVELPGEAMEANRNPHKRDPALTAQAQENLETWYKEDYRFLAYIRNRFVPDPNN